MWAAIPGAGQAQVRVVVERFTGPQSAPLRAALMANFAEDERYEVVGLGEVNATARDFGIHRPTLREDEYPMVAAPLSVAAFIRGTVTRERRRWTLTVTIRNAADGLRLGSVQWSGRTVGSLNAIRRNGAARLAGLLAAASVPTGRPRASGQSPAAGGSGTTGGAAQTSQAQDAPPPPPPRSSGPRPWYAVGQDGGFVGGGDEEGEGRGDDDLDFRPSVRDERRQSWLSLALLTGTMRRSMVANALVDGARRGDSGVIAEQRRYQSAGLGHMELGLEGVFYPGAIGDAQEIPWFGAVASYRHSLFLTSFGCPNRADLSVACFPEERLEVGTTQTELYLGARGRFRIGETRDSPELGADFGFGNFSFTLDPLILEQLEPNAVIPPLSYSFLNLGAFASVSLVPTYLRVGVRASYRLGLGIGALAKAVWGIDTQPGSGFSATLEARSQAPYIADGVYFGLDVQFFRFTTAFRGQTACAAPTETGECMPGAPWEEWPSEDGIVFPGEGGIEAPVADDYLRLGVAIGYEFH